MRRNLFITAIQRVAGVIALSLFPCMASMAVGNVDFSATLQPSTCDLTFESGITAGEGGQSGIMELDPVTLAALENASETAPLSGKALILRLSNCQGVGGLDQFPTITISGESDGTDGRKLFRSASSSSSGAGFVIFYDTSSGPNGNQVNPAGTDWKLATTATVPADRELPFWVGISKVAGETVTPGEVNATVRFEFAWK